MARTTDAEVAAVIEVDSDIDLTPFITIANELVTEVCTDSGYTDTRLTLIETWLAAHFYGVRDQQVERERAGKVEVRYQYEIGLFLHQTKQGQTALTLDTAGNLAKLSKQMEKGKGSTVGIDWLGTDLDEDDD